MSDAQGRDREPITGEPIEGSAEPAPTADDAARSEHADTDASGADVAHTEAATGDPGAEGEPPAPTSDTGDIPASRREFRNTGAIDTVASPQDDAAVTRPAADETPAAEEPDYAALAADLDALENRGATTTLPTRSADAGEPAKKPDPWFEPADTPQTFTASDAYDAPPAEPAITASEPVAPEHAAAAAPPAQLPIFVQAPEPPRAKGNRGASGAIGILAALVFAVLYFGATLGYRALLGQVSTDNVADASLELLTSFELWVPVVVFFLGFWLLGALVNRARWAAWVLLGVFVGAIAYLGHIAGQLVQAPFWNITPSEGFQLVEEQLLSPLAIAAFVFGREITIWFGAWAARRGARVTERNAEAQAEYERTLEAGPKLSR
jgi:hypothetical protein